MRSSPSALAALLAALGLPAWAQVGDGPVAPMTAPPTIYSSAPPSIAVRPGPSPELQVAPRPATFAAASVPSAKRMTSEARDERLFLRNAAAQSRFELDASKLAFAKSANPSVRALSAALINHHNTTGLELAHLLHSRGMALPMIGDAQRKALTELGKSSGSKFDAIYMQQVGLAQASVARDYEKASAAIREPQINAWIVKTLANTRFHQNLVERAVTADSKWNRLAPQARSPVGVQPVGATVDRLNGSDSR